VSDLVMTRIAGAEPLAVQRDAGRRALELVGEVAVVAQTAAVADPAA
jgi:hypothetical protein